MYLGRGNRKSACLLLTELYVITCQYLCIVCHYRNAHFSYVVTENHCNCLKVNILLFSINIGKFSEEPQQKRFVKDFKKLGFPVMELQQ